MQIRAVVTVVFDILPFCFDVLNNEIVDNRVCFDCSRPLPLQSISTLLPPFLETTKLYIKRTKNMYQLFQM